MKYANPYVLLEVLLTDEYLLGQKVASAGIFPFLLFTMFSPDRHHRLCRVHVTHRRTIGFISLHPSNTLFLLGCYWGISYDVLSLPTGDKHLPPTYYE